MKVIGKLADRLLSAVVPEISAGACCTESGQVYYVNCNECDGNGIGLEKKCVVNCYCQGVCGACNIKISSPGCR